MFKLVQLAVVTLPVMYHQCTYLLFQKLFTLSVSHILSLQQINTTMYVLSETVWHANYSKRSPQSQRQCHIANVNTYELQILPYYITQ